MPKIFISYRRDDSEHITGRIHDRLEPHFGRDNVFFDIDNIPFGVDFREHLDAAVGQCDILLAVIGDDWLDARYSEGPKAGQRRLDDAVDFVRIEIESALARGIPVIPVLVEKARMPGELELPEGLKRLAYRNAAEVRSGRDFHDHVERLIRGVEYLLKQGQGSITGAGGGRPKDDQDIAQLQQQGEAKLAQLVRQALDRTGGHPTAADTTAANDIMRQHRLPRERAKTIIAEVRQQWDREQPVKLVLHSEIVNSIGMKLMLIPEGKFQMGSPAHEQAEIRKTYGDDAGKWAAQETLHEVEISQPFYLAAFQVTQEQYQRFMGTNPSHFCASGGGKDKVRGIDTKRFPVECVTWDEAVAFCKKLSDLPEEKKAGRTYHLPTEAQWEYSCRGGAASYTPFHFGTSLSSTQANFDGNYPYGGAAKGPYLERPCPVGSFPANAFGLFDMHGNVYEWCLDWHDENYYKNSPKRDPQCPETGECRVLRGGSWGYYGSGCRAAYRNWDAPGGRDNDFGFRLCCLLDL